MPFTNTNLRGEVIIIEKKKGGKTDSDNERLAKDGPARELYRQAERQRGEAGAGRGRPLELQSDGDRAVVLQLYQHIGAEVPGPDLINPVPGQLLNEQLIERLGNLGGGGRGE